MDASVISAVNELCTTIAVAQKETMKMRPSSDQYVAILMNIAGKARKVSDLMRAASKGETAEKRKEQPLRDLSQEQFVYVADDGEVQTAAGEIVLGMDYDWAGALNAKRLGDAIAELPRVLRAIQNLWNAGILPAGADGDVLGDFLKLCGGALPETVEAGAE